VLNGDGTVTFTPNANYNGPADFTYTVTDGSLVSNVATVSVTVGAVNDAPVVTGGTISGVEDGAIVLSWTNFGISDIDSTITAVTVATLPADGTVQYFNGSTWVGVAAGQSISQADINSGNLRFVPDANESGSGVYAASGLGDQHVHYAGFDVSVTDSGGATATGNVTIDVAPVVDAVTLVADPSTTGSVSGGNSITPPPSVGLARDFYDNITTLTSGASSTDTDTMEAGIEGATATSTSTVTNVGVVGVGDGAINVPIAVDDAYQVRGLMYLEAGRTYTFSGYVDDSVRLEVGGETLASGRWGSYVTNDNYDGAGHISGASITPTVTGYYTVDLFLYNTSGPNGYDINVSVDGGAVQDLSTANFNLYTGIGDVDVGGGQHSGFVANAATGEGGYYPAALNTGLEDTAIMLSALTPSFGDTADNSESHIVMLSGIPVGATISDGTHTFTATAGNTSAVLWNEDNSAMAVGGSNWNLATLTVTPPVESSGSFDLTATATATEIATGDTTSAVTTLTVAVAAVNDAPVVGSATIALSEEGLTGGIADTTGTPDTTDAATATGTIAVSDVDSGALSVTLVAPTATLTSGGTAITWSGSGSQTLVGYAGATEVVRATIDDSGSYSVTLSKGIDQSGSGEGSVALGIGVAVSDGESTSTGTLNVAVEDDSPVASNTTVSLSGTATQTNLALVLDLSGSMDWASGMTSLSRLQATTAAIKELIDGYDSLGDVMVNITTFGTTASAGNWMTAANAIAFLDTVSANMGNTNYDAALAEAMSAFSSAGKLTGATVQNVLYFLSDGAPTRGDGNAALLLNASSNADTGIQGAEETIWTNFLTTNNINAYAIGLGTGVTTSAMDPVAYDGSTGTNQGSIAVTDLNDLGTVLGSTITNSISGAFAAGGGAAGGFGGDGGYMAAVTYGADTFSFDGSALSVSGSGGAVYTFDSSSHVLNITSVAGHFIVDMDTGAYTYTTSTSPAISQEVFGYTLLDADGDSASGNLTINLAGYNDAPIARDDSVIVASGSVSSNTVTISDAWLTWNDSDAEGASLSISAVSDASHVSGTVVDAVSGSNNGAGAFSYVASDGGQTNDASVSISTINSSTLNGTGLDNILIGDTDGEAIRGYEGNDVLVGNVGNDTLYGGTGNDLLIGGAGADTFRWSLGDAAGSPSDVVGDFDTATSGGDAINLRDLLVGEWHWGSDPGNLANYLHFSYADGNTTIDVTTHDANATTQTIVLEGVDLVGSYTTDAQVIQNLLNNGKLITD
ncbi:MAG: type I secretion C-terminal target domain-containing protein, partial [Gammaproteobacteria bacterium]|nr:type I secretion C-terminal target domain-containing protein [Gammaproteobacteria bacterium]MBU1415398.1 type I secretion C-terminal target domain-containing protein [Gammaproteobacteria bacterium]